MRRQPKRTEPWNFQLAELYAISQTARLDMFVAFPLEKKSPEAGGSNTALGAFSYWINPAGGSLVTLSATSRRQEYTQVF